MANVLQDFNDSAVGVVVGTALHTLGAIGLLGGLVGYIVWHRHLRHGHHHANALVGATVLTYLSILVNLVGGFMRTYESGHPHLTEFATSAWVRAITIKHVFLFIGMGAAIYLLEKVAPRDLRAMRDGALAKDPATDHAVGVLLVSLGILVSAVLGAVSTVTAIGGGDMGDADDDEGMTMPDRYHNATGQLVTSPLSPGSSTGSFEVPNGTTDIDVLLEWTPTQSDLAIEVSRTGRAFSPGGSAGQREGSLGEVPEPGTWTYRITSVDPVANVQWTLTIRLPQAHVDPV